MIYIREELINKRFAFTSGAKQRRLSKSSDVFEHFKTGLIRGVNCHPKEYGSSKFKVIFVKL